MTYKKNPRKSRRWVTAKRYWGVHNMATPGPETDRGNNPLIFKSEHDAHEWLRKEGFPDESIEGPHMKGKSPSVLIHPVLLNEFTERRTLRKLTR